MASNDDAYNELCCYTLTHGDPAFIHQHVVDAFAAQNADEHTKPIKLTFALIGLYLHVEKEFSGREVQRAHQFLAQHKGTWPSFPLPHDRGSLTAADVNWCVAVWNAFRGSHQTVTELLQELNFAA